MKEQNKIPEKEQNKLEKSNVFDAELKNTGYKAVQ